MTATLPTILASFSAPAPPRDDELAMSEGPKFIPQKYALDDGLFEVRSEQMKIKLNRS